MKIRTRLCLAFVLLVGLGFYKLVDWIVKDLRPRYMETMEESMVDIAALLSSLPEVKSADGAPAVDDLRRVLDAAGKKTFSARIYDFTKTRLDVRVYVTDRKGIVLFDSHGGRDEGRDFSKWNDVARTLKGQYGARTTLMNPKDPRTSILYVAAPIKRNGEIVGVLTVCKPADSVTQFQEAARSKIILGGILAGLAVLLLGLIFSIWVTRPIQKLIDYAHQVRDGRRAILPALGRSELAELGGAFEQMRDALEGKQYVEQYVQTLTHEMKSPLSAIRGAAELMEEEMPREQREQFLKNIRTEVNRVQNLVDRLLQLSALESRKELRDVDDVVLNDLVAEVISSLGPVLTAKGLSVESPAPAPVRVRGERFLLRQVLANLLQNAVEFSPRGGVIRVGLKTDTRVAEVTVEDSGPGIPDYALGRVFDRFYSLQRPDTGQKSSGLGLTFVREAVLLHGGEVKLENRAEGGARAVVRLPLG